MANLLFYFGLLGSQRRRCHSELLITGEFKAQRATCRSIELGHDVIRLYSIFDSQDRNVAAAYLLAR